MRAAPAALLVLIYYDVVLSLLKVNRFTKDAIYPATCSCCHILFDDLEERSRIPYNVSTVFRYNKL